MNVISNMHIYFPETLDPDNVLQITSLQFITQNISDYYTQDQNRSNSWFQSFFFYDCTVCKVCSFASLEIWYVCIYYTLQIF